MRELARYVVLNPVRAAIVREPGEWPWSSYRLTAGEQNAVPEWVDVDWLLSGFGKGRSGAIAAYSRFVRDGVGLQSPLEQIKDQLYLGDEAFVERLQTGPAAPEHLREISKTQRRALAKPLSMYAAEYPEPNEAMARAYLSGAYTMQQIGEHFGVHYMTVSRAVRGFERKGVLEC